MSAALETDEAAFTHQNHQLGFLWRFDDDLEACSMQLVIMKLRPTV